MSRKRKLERCQDREMRRQEKTEKARREEKTENERRDVRDRESEENQSE
jgi:hypothetical protein